MNARVFVDSPAVRSEVPLLVGLVGPSGGGKTFSALRLATGIQAVVGGEIYYIDTEANRALHYADSFKFRHIPFGAPFAPSDYLAAVKHCQSQGAKTVIVDSASHEHEGPGGVLEMHYAEQLRLAKGDETRTETYTFPAWSKPKAERRAFINALLQMQMNFIFCFRAKEKTALVKEAKDNGYTKTVPKALGWQPIAGEEYVFEMTINCLLLPGAGGVPTWNPEEKAERQMVKLPGQFKSLFKDGQPLSEEIGRGLAEWAKGRVKGQSGQGMLMQSVESKPSEMVPSPTATPETPGLSDADYLALKDGLLGSVGLNGLQAAWQKVNAVKASLSVDQLAGLEEVKNDRKRELGGR